MSLTIDTTSVQAMGVALATDIGSGATIEVRTGTKPATPATAATGLEGERCGGGHVSAAATGR